MFLSSPADVRDWRIRSCNLVTSDPPRDHCAHLPECGINDCQTGLILSGQAAQHALEARIRRFSPHQHRIGRGHFDIRHQVRDVGW